METEKYFDDLNYSLSNEDTRIEYELLPEGAQRVFSIAGSGARCLPLLAKNPKHLDVVDMSENQIFLFELRWRATQVMSYEEWLFFMGYRGGIQAWSEGDDSRFELFEKINLSTAARNYWLLRRSGWENQGFLRLGRWEKHFQRVGGIFRNFLKCDFSPIFKAQTIPEQLVAYEKFWPHRRFKALMQVVASEFVFNKFLYKGHFSGAGDRRTESRSPSTFLLEELYRLFQTQLVRKNYFLQILFLGEIRYEEGLPWEAHRHIFEAIKSSKAEVTMRVGNLLEELPRHAYDFISLSDTISYLPEEDARNILHKLHPGLNVESSLVVIRSFLRAPRKINYEGWIECLDKNEWAHRIDGSGVYQFHIFKKHQ